MRKKIISSFLASTVLLATGMVSVRADYQPLARYPAEVPYEKNKKKETPLMVIRFNQPDVAYEQPLYETMVKAFQVKPSAHFDIVSVSQHSSNKDIQQRYDQAAAENANRVLSTFQEIGMPPERLSLSTTSDNVQASEVRIFVH